MPQYKVRINGAAEFDYMSGATSASAAADEIQRHAREGDGNQREIRAFWDRIAVLEVTKTSD